MAIGQIKSIDFILSDRPADDLIRADALIKTSNPLLVESGHAILQALQKHLPPGDYTAQKVLGQWYPIRKAEYAAKAGK